jgi:hypothetical protein
MDSVIYDGKQMIYSNKNVHFKNTSFRYTCKIHKIQFDNYYNGHGAEEAIRASFVAVRCLPQHPQLRITSVTVQPS